MTAHEPKLSLGQTKPNVFAGPVAPRCRRPLRWLLLVGVLLLTALIALHSRRLRVTLAPASFQCELRLGPDDFGGLTIIGDLHGDYPALLELLRHAGLIPPAQANETARSLEQIVGAARRGNDVPAAAACSRWLGPPGHTLVQLGDNVDRGPGAAAVVACLRACQIAARAGGGHVVRLVGNHELMWFQGAFRYAHDAGDPPHTRSRLVADWTDEVLTGRVRGAWASGPMLFVHAGLRPEMLDRLMLRGSLDDEVGFTRLASSLPNASLASRVADRISVALASAVAKCAAANETTTPTRRRCLKLSDHDGLFSAGPDRGGRGLGGPFWTDWSVLRHAEPTTSGMMMGTEDEHKGDQWIWPPARLTRGFDDVNVLEPSESNTFIQIVGHTPARCSARDDKRCEPIRARSDLAAIVTDAAISAHYGGNRAYVTVSAQASPAKTTAQLSVGHHIVSVTRGHDDEWRQHDLTAASCGTMASRDSPVGNARNEATDELISAVFADDAASSAIPLGPG